MLSLNLAAGQQSLAELPVPPGWFCWCWCFGRGDCSQLWLCWAVPNSCCLEPHPTLPHRNFSECCTKPIPTGCGPTDLEGTSGTDRVSFSLCILESWCVLVNLGCFMLPSFSQPCRVQQMWTLGLCIPGHMGRPGAKWMLVVLVSVGAVGCDGVVQTLSLG